MWQRGSDLSWALRSDTREKNLQVLHACRKKCETREMWNDSKGWSCWKQRTKQTKITSNISPSAKKKTQKKAQKMLEGRFLLFYILQILDCLCFYATLRAFIKYRLFNGRIINNLIRLGGNKWTNNYLGFWNNTCIIQLNGW